jgi:hypothetical protein
MPEDCVLNILLTGGKIFARGGLNTDEKFLFFFKTGNRNFLVK